MEKKRRAVSIGKFECIHRGHQRLLANIRAQKEKNMESTVITIDMPGKKQVLLDGERRDLLHLMHVDSCISMPLDEQFMEMEPEAFVKNILVDRLNVGYVTAGVDFRFGRNRKGDGEMLKLFGKAYDFEVVLMEKEMEQGREISSSWIREELRKGNISLVNRLLGYGYFIGGEVTHGNQIGRDLDMPTVNLQLSERKLVPPNGVYFSYTIVGGKIYNSITNIGYRPTIHENEKILGAETHIYDFQEDIYGETVRVVLCEYVRAEQQFLDLEQLRVQINKDMEQGKAYFSGNL